MIFFSLGLLSTYSILRVQGKCYSPREISFACRSGERQEGEKRLTTTRHSAVQNGLSREVILATRPPGQEVSRKQINNTENAAPPCTMLPLLIMWCAVTFNAAPRCNIRHVFCTQCVPERFNP